MVMTKQLVEKQIEDVIENEKKVTHEKLAQDVEDAFQVRYAKMRPVPEIWSANSCVSVRPLAGWPQNPIQFGIKISADLLEPCYTPIIQSGGTFDLKPSATSNTDKLYYGTITVSFAVPFAKRESSVN